jgi:hypothetical protein
MDSDEYRSTKIFLGITNPDIWSGLTGISKDTDKSISCGRLAVSDKLQMRLAQLKATQAKTAEKFVEQLKMVFDGDSYDLALSPETNNIAITGGHANISIVFENEGKDHFGNFFYSLRGKGGLKNIFLFYPKTGPVSGQKYTIDDCEWYWWRVEGASPDEPRMIAFQSYKNEINASIFERTLGIRV